MFKLLRRMALATESQYHDFNPDVGLTMARNHSIPVSRKSDLFRVNLEIESGIMAISSSSLQMEHFDPNGLY
jgi:hypothetical protein